MKVFLTSCKPLKTTAIFPTFLWGKTLSWKHNLKAKRSSLRVATFAKLCVAVHYCMKFWTPCSEYKFQGGWPQNDQYIQIYASSSSMTKRHRLYGSQKEVSNIICLYYFVLITRYEIIEERIDRYTHAISKTQDINIEWYLAFLTGRLNSLKFINISSGCFVY